MKFSLADESGGNSITAYDSGSLVIRERVYRASLIVTVDRVIADWRPQEFQALQAEDLAVLVELGPDLVILGTGGEQHFPDVEIYQSLIQAGIGLEVMTTPAACRTFNILIGEGRKAAAALLL